MNETLQDPQAILAQLAEGNPALAAMLQMMARPRETPAEAPAPAADPRVPKLESLVKRMYHDLKAAEDRLSLLAAALGACGICWGEDSACLGCRGRGRPGMLAPDPELRKHLFSGSPTAGAPLQPAASTP